MYSYKTRKTQTHVLPHFTTFYVNTVAIMEVYVIAKIMMVLILDSYLGLGNIVVKKQKNNAKVCIMIGVLKELTVLVKY